MARKKKLETRVVEEMERIAFPEGHEWESAPKVSEQIRALEFLSRYHQDEGKEGTQPQRLDVHILSQEDEEK